MEIYILDSLYRTVAVVDKFKSFIWTERFSASGDFELDVFSTLENRRIFVPGVRLSHPNSYRVMTIETVEDVTDVDGARLLKVKGPSLESILQHRLAMADLTNLTDDPKWVITDVPAAIARQLFHDICVTGVIDSGDIIPGVVEDNVLFPVDTIAEPTDVIVYSIDPKPLYTAEKELCDAFAMGFRLVLDSSTNTLYFDVYMGSDRTTTQTTLPAVIFSPDMDNLRDTNKLTSTALYKNVAYVISPVGHEVVYPADVDPTVAGFERRALVVVASDITDPDGPTASDQMIQRGKDELAKNRVFTVLDGEVAQTSQFKYGVDYNLGDLVELSDDDGTTSTMQVTEQIFVSDAEGDRSFPALSVNTFIFPGSWLDWPISQEWADLNPDPTEWADLP